MKVTKPQVVTVVVFAMSSLLLIFAANCSFERKTTDETSLKKVEEISIGQQAKEKPAEEGTEEVSVEQQVKEEPAEEQAEEKTFVANLFCSACHYAFGDEELALNHERVGIGCERCHGESERHRSDEDNITPPEIMYPKAKINPTCMMCHPRGKIKHVSLHASLLAGAETIFDKDTDESTGQMKYCTDCHGKEHRMNVRTIRWNKATGELLEE
ncbi:MAG TPA: hypothetical protein VMW72_24775 [Sedimentisphaerales bacterium]|nr:hypothetical protein [Sedimentisphaerales bacterium]